VDEERCARLSRKIQLLRNPKGNRPCTRGNETLRRNPIAIAAGSAIYQDEARAVLERHKSCDSARLQLQDAAVFQGSRWRAWAIFKAGESADGPAREASC